MRGEFERSDWDQRQDDIGAEKADRDALYGQIRGGEEIRNAGLSELSARQGDVDNAIGELVRDVPIMRTATVAVRARWAAQLAEILDGLGVAS